MVIDWIILIGLGALGFSQYLVHKDLEDLEQVVVSILVDLGKQGILKVEVEDDDS